ncbi:hypothetical protein [Burkholderia sp. MSMB1078WGS]|uniref:hypothetical protein n=1 Tax=Burkholderia sp. MSMB1078WGS TaxID=1637900 RepID=UPI000ADD1D3E|nr:hypothetical protein [Burkholderia sp. MSMB1078WGS]
MSFRLWMHATLIAALGSLVTLIITTCGSSSSMQASDKQQIRHVFVITLENENFSTTFGAKTKAPYLATTLPAQGELVSQYYGTDHARLDNYIAMISGQSSTPDTANDCVKYTDATLTGATPDGQAIDTDARIRRASRRCTTSSRPPASRRTATKRTWTTTRRAKQRPAAILS